MVCLSHSTVVLCIQGWSWLASIMCVLKEIPIITFSLWFTKVLASLICRYGQKVTLVEKWVNYMYMYMPGKGVKLEIAIL